MPLNTAIELFSAIPASVIDQWSLSPKRRQPQTPRGRRKETELCILGTDASGHLVAAREDAARLRLGAGARDG